MADLKRWTAPALAFLAGVAVTYVLFYAPTAANVPWYLRWVFVPGFAILIPIYVITGRIQDDIISWLVPPANGLAYVLILLSFRGIRNKIRAQSRKAR